jgi:DNA polymerase I
VTPISSSLDRFEEIVLCDFEFIAQPGERPDVVCLAAVELRSGRKFKLWRDELEALPPYRTDDKALFVCFVANAEILCHLARGWQVPKNILDLSPVFRCVTSGRHAPEGRGLIGAQRWYGLDAISSKLKDTVRDRIAQGWPFTPEEREKILDYCLSDTVSLARLLPAMLPDIEHIGLDVALYWGEFAAVSALMAHYGVPIDMEIFPRLTDKKIWKAIGDDMVPAVNAAFDTYVRNKAGDWVFVTERWHAYLKRIGWYDLWPKRVNAKGETVLDMRRNTFENMTKGCPQLEPLRQLRHVRDKMRKIKLAVGADGRNRTVLWPFQSKTGRTQPKAAEWIFSPAVWLRSLIKPDPCMAVAYIDYSSMEFLLAAARSGDRNMFKMYNTGDPYWSFAKSVGAVPRSAVRDKNGPYEPVRDNYKVMLLSTQYGLSAPTLAARLKIPLHEAHEMLAQHHSQFSPYWAWSDDYVQQALQTGTVRTAYNWSYHVGLFGQINDRSLRNWPIQSDGADILRIACILAVRHGIKILAPVHDAVLIEAPIERIEADVALMQEIMRRASRIVLNDAPDGPYELRTDAKIVKYPERYTDKRGDEIWAQVLDLLAAHERELKKRRA